MSKISNNRHFRPDHLCHSNYQLTALLYIGIRNQIYLFSFQLHYQIKWHGFSSERKVSELIDERDKVKTCSKYTVMFVLCRKAVGSEVWCVDRSSPKNQHSSNSSQTSLISMHIQYVCIMPPHCVPVIVSYLSNPWREETETHLETVYGDILA